MQGALHTLLASSSIELAWRNDRLDLRGVRCSWTVLESREHYGSCRADFEADSAAHAEDPEVDFIDSTRRPDDVRISSVWN